MPQPRGGDASATGSPVSQTQIERVGERDGVWRHTEVGSRKGARRVAGMEVVRV